MHALKFVRKNKIKLNSGVNLIQQKKTRHEKLYISHLNQIKYVFIYNFIVSNNHIPNMIQLCKGKKVNTLISIQ